MAKIVLLEPQIPQNTGNIARLCAVTGSSLVLLGHLGFELSDKYLKRAGMDYWSKVKIEVHPNMEEYMTEHMEKTDLSQSFLLSTKGKSHHTQARYSKDSVLFFGNEGRGTPDWIMKLFEAKQHVFRIPQKEGERCLNLAVSAGIALYELLRQVDFDGLQ